MDTKPYPLHGAASIFSKRSPLEFQQGEPFIPPPPHLRINKINTSKYTPQPASDMYHCTQGLVDKLLETRVGCIIQFAHVPSWGESSVFTAITFSAGIPEDENSSAHALWLLLGRHKEARWEGGGGGEECRGQYFLQSDRRVV